MTLTPEDIEEIRELVKLTRSWSAGAMPAGGMERFRELNKRWSGVDFPAVLLREVDRLREALKFYADPRKYTGPNQKAEPDEESIAGYRIDVCRDLGARARSALKGTT